MADRRGQLKGSIMSEIDGGVGGAHEDIVFGCPLAMGRQRGVEVCDLFSSVGKRRRSLCPRQRRGRIEQGLALLYLTNLKLYWQGCAFSWYKKWILRSVVNLQVPTLLELSG